MAQADAAHGRLSRRRSIAGRARFSTDLAGDYIHGKLAEPPKPSEIAANPQSVGDGFRQAFRGLADTAKDLADPKGLLGIGSDMPAGSANPVERAAAAADEHRRRDQARARYLASPVPTVTISRIATRGRTQHDEVAQFLASTGIAARPELVYGVFRVPDRISPLMPDPRRARRGMGGRAPRARGRRYPPTAVERVRRGQTVGRANRRPAIGARRGCGDSRLDRNGSGATALPWHQPRYPDGEDQRLGRRIGRRDPVYARVTGVRVLTPHATLPATDSVDVPLGGQPRVHVEVMNWAAVAVVVHPRPQRGPEIPSPFPYLPATPDELLVAYLQIVGIDPADRYAVSTTIDEFFAMGQRTTKDSERVSLDDLKLTDAEELPCADGKARRRYHGTTRVVVAYPDVPNTPSVAIGGRAIRTRFCMPVYRFAPALDDQSAETAAGWTTW